MIAGKRGTMTSRVRCQRRERRLAAKPQQEQRLGLRLQPLRQRPDLGSAKCLLQIPSPLMHWATCLALPLVPYTTGYRPRWRFVRNLCLAPQNSLPKLMRMLSFQSAENGSNLSLAISSLSQSQGSETPRRIFQQVGQSGNSKKALENKKTTT